MKLKRLLCSSACTCAVLQSCAAVKPESNGRVLKIVLPIVGTVAIGGGSLLAWTLLHKKEAPKKTEKDQLADTNLNKGKENGDTADQAPEQPPTPQPLKPNVLVEPEPEPIVRPQDSNSDVTPVISEPADSQNGQTIAAPATPLLTDRQSVQPKPMTADEGIKPKLQPTIAAPATPLLTDGQSVQPKPMTADEGIKPKLQPTIAPKPDDESVHPNINVSMPSFDFSKYSDDANDVDALEALLNDFKPNYEGHGVQCGELVETSLGGYPKWSDYKNADICVPSNIKFKDDLALRYISPGDVKNKISGATGILNSEPPLLQIDSKGKGVMIVGDLHGNIYSLRGILLHFLDMLKADKVSHILFMGDFTDRRFYGVESLTLLSYMKTLMPDKVYLTRGNHEDYQFYYAPYMSAIREANCKYPGEGINGSIFDLHKSLPFAAVINGTALCLHGGIIKEFKEAGGLEKINSIDRTAKIFELRDHPIASGITWGEVDHSAKGPGFKTSTRGIGYVCSPADLKECLKNNDLKTLFSGHVHETSVHDMGDGYSHVTLLSSENYAGQNEDCNVAVLNPDGTFYVEKVSSDGTAEK